MKQDQKIQKPKGSNYVNQGNNMKKQSNKGVEKALPFVDEKKKQCKIQQVFWQLIWLMMNKIP